MFKQATMRSIFWLLILAAAAVALAMLVTANHATVTLFWAPNRVDVSFNFLLFVCAVVFVVLHLALRGLATLRALPQKASRWRAIQTERSIAHDLLDALAQLNAGRFLTWLCPSVSNKLCWRTGFGPNRRMLCKTDRDGIITSNWPWTPDGPRPPLRRKTALCSGPFSGPLMTPMPSQPGRGGNNCPVVPTAVSKPCV
jgi:HemY protein N-terminus